MTATRLTITSGAMAHAAGKLAAALGMPTYDLTGEMKKRGIPVEFQCQWLSGVEDVLGCDDRDETNEAEDRALVQAFAS